MGMALLERHAFDLTEQSLRSAVTGHPAVGHCNIGLVEALWRQGGQDEAVALVRGALAQAPEPHAFAKTIDRLLGAAWRAGA